MPTGFRFPSPALHAFSLALLGLLAPALWSQSDQGSVNVTVTDPAGALVPGAKLELKAADTNDLRTGTSQEKGTYRFVGLNIGKYALTVTKEGFGKFVVDPVEVEATRVTDVAVQLTLGTTATTVEVNSSATPVLEVSSNMIGTTLDVKQIENLPLGGRNLTQLAQLAPGYNGTWNGAPSVAQGNNIDGIIASPSRMKFTGNSNPSIAPRLESIAEMTVQTDQLDVDQGFGQATMQISFITRSGSNQFHGRLYEDFRNKDLNANTWANNGRGIARAPYILNDFGGSAGGRIIKNKLFFFGSFGMSKQPGSITASNTVLTTAAQTGNFTYVTGDGKSNTVNVLGLARSFNPSLPSTINPIIASQIANINGGLGGGVVTASPDPNINNINWLVNSPTTNYYPAGRLDYNPSDKLRFHLSFNQQRRIQPSSQQPLFPGDYFASQTAGFKSNGTTYSLGVDYSITPTIVNQFKAGFLYNPVLQPWYQGAPLWTTSVGVTQWGLASSGTDFTLPISNYYPVITLSDAVAWQKGSHQMKFGFSGFQEHDLYWNAPAGITYYNLGLAQGDPALGAFTIDAPGLKGSLPGATTDQAAEAQNLYATLVGRISGASGQYGLDPKTKKYLQTPGSNYNLNELLRSWGLYAQDSWHLRAGLTINLGLRWDFTGDNHDLTGAYHNAQPQDIYGPSGVGNLFKPGQLGGDMNPNITARAHAYSGWNVSPQPQVGIAWRPDYKSGLGGKLLGQGTVVRGGFSVRRYTEPQQYFWNQATNYGSLYYQQYYLNPNTSGQPGTFAPGSLVLGNQLPAFGYSPASKYEEVAPLSEYTFTSLNYLGNVVNGMNPKIAQPYTESWNIGIQHELGQSRVLEVRYNGNRSRNQWLSKNINEVNIFENGFLTQFKTAQTNLKINQQNGINSFANNGFAGQGATPIFNAAFAGEPKGATGVPLQDYGDSSMITYLNTGQAGALASVLSGINGNAPYFCNLVGSSFAPCVTNAGYTGAGAGYPINFFQANPFSAGAPIQYMDADGYSNYHALQVDLRQRQWHGLEFDANYTWSHTLGLATPNDWTAASSQFTLRDLRMSYGPTLYDLRHVVHASVTADLPFGKGRHWLNHAGVVNNVLGGWTIGNILTIQSGTPRAVTGGNLTVNDYGDGGVLLNGITARDLQNSVGVHYVPSANGAFVDLIDPKYMVRVTGGGANPNYATVNNNAGIFGQSFYLRSPRQWFNDTSVSKIFPITERVRFSFQMEMLNVFNHPNFGWRNTAILSSSFGTGSPNGTPRNIEFRGNIEF
jgi:hypothetical protein